MASFDKESEIFNAIQLSLNNEDKICLLTESDTEKSVLQSLSNIDNWIDNSANTNYPPDYYNNNDGYMMDFMRTNDYEKRKKSGKVKNEVATQENLMLKELKNSGILEQFPNVENVFLLPNIIIKPSLTLYRNNIKSVIMEHNRQVSTYRNNHPGLKIIFCVCDLSEHVHKMRPDNCKEIFIYNPCFDKEVIKTIKSLDIEFLIWFRPFLDSDIDSPKIVIIDIKKLNPDIFLEIKESENL